MLDVIYVSLNAIVFCKRQPNKKILGHKFCRVGQALFLFTLFNLTVWPSFGAASVVGQMSRLLSNSLLEPFVSERLMFGVELYFIFYSKNY